MIKLIPILFVTVILCSCNNSSQTNDAKNDTIQNVKETDVDAGLYSLLGTWVIPKPAKLGQVEGFDLKRDSVVTTVNTPILEYKKWWRNGDQLIFTIQSAGDLPAIEVNDTLIVYSVNNDSLVIAPIGNRNVKMIYRKQHVANVAFVNTRWQLARMDGMPVNDSIFIKFDSTGLGFTGYGGCNYIKGTYRTGASSIRISRPSGAKKKCSPEINKVENRLLAYVQSTNNYFIVGDELQLREGAKTLAVFKAAN